MKSLPLLHDPDIRIGPTPARVGAQVAASKVVPLGMPRQIFALRRAAGIDLPTGLGHQPSVLHELGDGLDPGLGRRLPAGKANAED